MGDLAPRRRGKSRNANGEGGVYHRADGRWEGKFFVEIPPEGRRSGESACMAIASVTFSISSISFETSGAAGFPSPPPLSRSPNTCRIGWSTSRSPASGGPLTPRTRAMSAYTSFPALVSASSSPCRPHISGHGSPSFARSANAAHRGRMRPERILVVALAPTHAAARRSCHQAQFVTY